MKHETRAYVGVSVLRRVGNPSSGKVNEWRVNEEAPKTSFQPSLRTGHPVLRCPVGDVVRSSVELLRTAGGPEAAGGSGRSSLLPAALLLWRIRIRRLLW
jgi:hypothetical protein